MDGYEFERAAEQLQVCFVLTCFRVLSRVSHFYKLAAGAVKYLWSILPLRQLTTARRSAKDPQACEWWRRWSQGATKGQALCEGKGSRWRL